MIRVFRPTDKSFNNNGDAVILPTKARVKNEDNGDFYLDLNIDYKYNNYIEPNNIIVCNTPQGEQAFRIREIDKVKNRLEVRAWALFYDADNYLIADKFIQNETCNEALKHLNGGLDNPSPFQVYSDITAVNSYRCVRTPFSEAITTIIERWGGHLVRDNFHISIMQNIGQDNGITIAYRKNLEELTAKYDFSTVVTKLLPVGKDGTLLDELYLESEIQYAIPYTKTVTFEQDIDEDNYKLPSGETDTAAYKAALQSDLKKQALKYLNLYCMPTINYTLKGNPEQVADIGDIIEVKDERLGVDVMTQVIAYEYDAILNKYTSLEFGNFTKTLNNLMANITHSTQGAIDNALNSVSISINNAVNTAYNKVWASLQSSYCIFKGDEILIVDSLPANTAVNVIKINKDGVAFSADGVEGTYKTAWSISDVLDFANITADNFTLDMIAGGVLQLNDGDAIEVYDAQSQLIGRLNSNGLELGGVDVLTALNGKQDALTAGNNITISNNVISATSGGINYSQTEQDTGLKWIDNKPIYQKTIVVNGLSNGQQIQVGDVDKFISFEGMLYYPDYNERINIPSYQNDRYYVRLYGMTDSSPAYILAEIGNDTAGENIGEVWVNVRYTKN